MMTETARDPREGVLEEVGGRWRLRFVRRLAHPPAKVWRALTEEEHLVAWFPFTIEGRLEAGAPLTFGTRSDEPPEVGEMIECDPPRVLEFVWGGPPRPGDRETVRIELEPDADGCVLTFLTTYDELGKSARDAAGWHVCLDLLEEELAGGAEPDPGNQRWKPLNARYQERFGPAASTIGPPPGHEPA